MRCWNCGGANPNSATTCMYCGEALRPLSQPHYKPRYRPPSPTTPVKIPNYMPYAVVGTLFCVPGGILAMIFAALANKYARTGDARRAMAAANWAKFWSYCCFVTGVITFVTGFIYLILIASGIIPPPE